MTTRTAAPYRFTSLYVTSVLLLAWMMPWLLTQPDTPFQDPSLQPLTTLVTGLALGSQWLAAPLTIVYGFLAAGATDSWGWRGLHLLSAAAGLFVLILALGRVFTP